MNVIFQIEGDLGINIAATAVCKAIKGQFPQSKLILLTSFPCQVIGRTKGSFLEDVLSLPEAK